MCNSNRAIQCSFRVRIVTIAPMPPYKPHLTPWLHNDLFEFDNRDRFSEWCSPPPPHRSHLRSVAAEFHQSYHWDLEMNYDSFIFVVLSSFHFFPSFSFMLEHKKVLSKIFVYPQKQWMFVINKNQSIWMDQMKMHQMKMEPVWMRTGSTP